MDNAPLMESTTRVVLPDLTRAISLLGIALVNVAYLGLSNDGVTADSLLGPINWVAGYLTFFLANAKFYLLFSFLFGYSSSFILKDGSAPQRKKFRRRLIALLALGLTHGIFLFHGDILVTYALAGLLLVPLYLARRRWIIFWATAAFLIPTVLLSAISLLTWLLAPTPEDLGNATEVVGQIGAAGFWDAAWLRLTVLPETWLLTILIQGSITFTAILMGVLAARSRLLSNPRERLVLWKWLACAGLSIGLPLQAYAAWYEIESFARGDQFSTDLIMAMSINILTAPILSAGYLGALAWWLGTRTESQLAHLRRTLLPMGQMSLSVYLAESAIMMLVFAPYGLGLFAQVGTAAAAGIAIATWAALLWFSNWWMRRHRQGPMESIVAAWVGRTSVDASRQAPTA